MTKIDQKVQAMAAQTSPYTDDRTAFEVGEDALLLRLPDSGDRGAGAQAFARQLGPLKKLFSSKAPKSVILRQAPFRKICMTPLETLLPKIGVFEPCRFCQNLHRPPPTKLSTHKKGI